MVTTGQPKSTSVKTESFDAIAQTTCQSVPDYPLQVDEATGAFVNSKFVICGGRPTTSNCYTLSRNETAWKPSGNLVTPREAAASVEINNKLVIFGGYNAGYLQSTEKFDGDNGISKAGTNMPWAIGYHCAVKVNETTALIIGGYGSSILRSTYFYNANLKIFIPGPLLNVGRSGHGCSILNTGTERFVIVSGGYTTLGGYRRLDSTEVMDLKQPTMWKAGL